MESPKRKQIRLKEYDYSSAGAYFVTVCTEGRRTVLSKIRRGDPCGRPYTELTVLGEISEKTFALIEERYDIVIDRYVIMPDHIHFILYIPKERATARVAPTTGQIVGAYKSLVVKEWRERCNKRRQIMGKLWQRNYYEHIIRNRDDLAETRKYIEENPLRWYYKNNIKE